jgi:REP element-mobilizing transposase RayT
VGEVNDRQRKRLRLNEFDYRQPGAYFVTICVANREALLGMVKNGEFVPSDVGSVVESTLLEMPDRFDGCLIDSYVVMPNHVHAVVMLGAVPEREDAVVGQGGSRTAPTNIVGDGNEQVTNDLVGAGLDLPSPQPRPNPSLADVVRAFKTISATRANRILERTGAPFWQRNYYEHVIRNDTALNRIRQYIANNPANWAVDEENPMRR